MELELELGIEITEDCTDPPMDLTWSLCSTQKTWTSLMWKNLCKKFENLKFSSLSLIRTFDINPKPSTNDCFLNTSVISINLEIHLYEEIKDFWSTEKHIWSGTRLSHTKRLVVNTANWFNMPHTDLICLQIIRVCCDELNEISISKTHFSKNKQCCSTGIILSRMQDFIYSEMMI